MSGRERALLSALQGVVDSDVDAVDAAEEAVRRYPDDPDLWNALGELYVHVGPKALRPVEDEKEALQRASDLLPEFVPYLIHLTEYELSYGDSAAAAELVRREDELVTDTSVSFPRGHRIAFDVIYGDSAAGYGDLVNVNPGGSGYLLRAMSGPRRLEERESITRALWESDRQNSGYQDTYATALVNRGRIHRALEVAPGSTAVGARLWTVLGHYDLIPADSLASVDWSSWENAESFGAVFTALVQDDTATAARARASPAFERDWELSTTFEQRFLDGLWLWKTAGPAAAEPVLLEAHDALGGSGTFVLPYVQWMLGSVYEELGDLRQAFEYFRAAARVQPLAALRAARLADRLGETDEARRLYQEVLIAWKDADPQFEPWLEEARRWSEPVPG